MFASASLTFPWLDILSLLPHDPLLCLITIHWKSYPCALCFGFILVSCMTHSQALSFSLGRNGGESGNSYTFCTSLQVWQWLHSCQTRVCTPSRYNVPWYFKYIYSINMIACIHFTNISCRSSLSGTILHLQMIQMIQWLYVFAFLQINSNTKKEKDERHWRAKPSAQQCMWLYLCVD